MSNAANAGNANAYLRTKVMSASPAELRLMLLDGSIAFALQAREGLESKNFEQSYNGFTQCRAIVLELTTTIKTEPDADLAERVKSLYYFMYSELVESSMNKDVERLDKVIELLRYERETWVLLMEKLAEEAGVSPANTSAEMPQPSAPAIMRPNPASQSPSSAGLSIQA